MHQLTTSTNFCSLDRTAISTSSCTSYNAATLHGWNCWNCYRYVYQWRRSWGCRVDAAASLANLGKI